LRGVWVEEVSQVESLRKQFLFVYDYLFVSHISHHIFDIVEAVDGYWFILWWWFKWMRKQVFSIEFNFMTENEWNSEKKGEKDSRYDTQGEKISKFK
jgi:hypothetical protein